MSGNRVDKCTQNTVRPPACLEVGSARPKLPALSVQQTNVQYFATLKNERDKLLNTDVRINKLPLQSSISAIELPRLILQNHQMLNPTPLHCHDIKKADINPQGSADIPPPILDQDPFGIPSMGWMAKEHLMSIVCRIHADQKADDIGGENAHI